ncbi:MAG: hypothetical protein LBU83_03275 [Bacteroidales bacterium]|jgi:hypothetical protein|nr:hypothetical protein [Bacteroidales bacterium]
MKRIRMTEKLYLSLFFVIALSVSIISLYVLSVYPDFALNSLGYDLVLILMSTAITVFFLSLIPIIREEKEWKNIGKYVNRMIASESTMITGELLNYLESEESITCFMLELSQNSDNKTKSGMIITRLRELQKKEKIELSAYAYDHESNDASLKVLLEAKSRLADIQIKYVKHLKNSDIVESLQKVQDGIALLNRSRELMILPQLMASFQNMCQQMPQPVRDSFQNMVKQSPIDVNSIIDDKTIPDQFQTVIQSFVELPIKVLLNEIIALWDRGITFSNIF